MARTQLSIAILAIEGTNCDQELAVALANLGARPEIVQLRQLADRDVAPEERRRLDDYDALFVPGGFSGGDYVRAGAILAARVRAAIGDSLEAFVRSGRLVGGICNGFQVVVELGLLPGRPGGRLGPPDAVLMTNDSGHFECRPTFVAWEGGKFPPLRAVAKGTRFLFPSAHAEGKLVLSGDAAARRRELAEAGQILFRWVAPDGTEASYPWNPNGSDGNVAGLTNPEGNVFGLMPHPERAFFRAQAPDWTRNGGPEGVGDGHRFLEAIVRHAERARAG
ncbi:MAG TPA: phosphoribosylformylglycinamidine synthase I [Thermoplasmata archaeon]|nr:phosphoribosylformylglycinamidine synthase I [Thermoplasmata archaeon]